MAKLTDDQLRRLLHHYADACADWGVTPGEVALRSKHCPGCHKGGGLKKGRERARIRRDLVVWLRETVFFKNGEMEINAGWDLGGGEPISDTRIAQLIGLADHSDIKRMCIQWKREHRQANGETISQDLIVRAKAEMRANETQASKERQC